MKYTALSPSLPIIVRLQFKASTLVTQSRQATILRDVNSFCTYLIFLGFKLPQDFPPIGVRDVSGYAYVQPAPVMYAQINIQDRRIDERNAIIGPFAGWLFHALLPGLVTDPKAWFDSDGAYLYAAYYTDSFEKRYTQFAQTAHLADWQNALWELRTKYGPGFVDHLLLYSYQSWAPPEPNDNFDRFFWARFQAGLFVIDNNAEHYDGVISVMKAYGLTRPSQEQK
jgi:hypothetical protein